MKTPAVNAGPDSSAGPHRAAASDLAA